MTETDTVIAAMRSETDRSTARVRRLSDDDLSRPSAAREWDVSQVVSHLGSGAVINLATLEGSLGGPAPGPGFNQGVWAKWNAMGRRERADSFLVAADALIERYESLTDDERENARIDLGFMPQPVPVAIAARMRLNELTLHSWDIRAAFDPTALLSTDAVSALLHGEPDMIGWIGKSEPLDGRELVVQVVTTDPASHATLHLGSSIRLEQGEATTSADGTLTLPAEAWLRLVAGRLGAEHTPDGIEVTGDVSLELLRRVFPGY